MTTKANLLRRAAFKLGIVSVGEELDSTFKTELEAAYSEVYGDLDDQGLVNWLIDDDLPDELAGDVAALIAWERVDAFTPSETKYKRLSIDVIGAVPNIRRLTSAPYVPDSEPVDY